VKAKSILVLAACIVLCELAGIIGSIFTISAIPTWYAGLEKPFFTPPSWAFAPVWLSLYFLMGIALYLVLEAKPKNKTPFIAFGTFGIQLALNVLWSIIFFGLKNTALAFAEIILLWIAIFLTILEFHKVSKKSAWLLLPYILWVSIASALNLSVWLLNY
jgi:tryptophan-rich sensory protein